MAKYGKLWFRVWSDDDFTALSGEAQRLFFVLVSYPTRSNAGVVPLQLKRWARTSSNGSVEAITDALKELDAARFVVVDWDTEEVLIRTFIRNDEVPKQPNLMKSALDSAEHLQSQRLRWALYHELLNQPDDKNPERTQAAAKALVAGLPEPLPEGLTEGFPEGLTEPLPEGLPEGSVVVGYLSRELPTTTSTATSPATATGSFAVEISGERVAVTASARELVHHSVPGPIIRSRSVRDGLYGHTQRLLDDGATPDQLEATLAEWSNRVDVYPGHLPHVYSELARRAAGATTTDMARKGTSPAPADARVARVQALKTNRQEIGA